jgi:AmmeMemoRadiSam system protein B
MTNPQLRRDIQLVSITVEGRQMITFIDSLKLVQAGFAIDKRMIPLLQMLDGKNDLRDIQMGLMRLMGGTIVPISEVEAFIGQLDRHFILESDAFHQKKTDLMEEFAQKTEREAMLADKSYEGDPEKLRRFINDTEARLALLPEADNVEIVGILAPHIDIGIARQAYVDVYRRLKGRRFDLVIIFGINHQGREGLFSVTEKDYLTPLGRMETDREFISALKSGLPEGTIAAYDFDHMMEHSIEFQTVFLAHYLGNGAKIVPVLCGGLHEFLASGSDPFRDSRFLAFRDATDRIIRERGRKVLFVSGVDFSHVGPKFGHSVPAEALLGRARANDELIISSLMEGKPEEIYRNALATQDQYNVCGLASMIIFTSLIGPCKAELLHYGTYDEPSTSSAVTYASMVFTRQGS